MSLSETLVPNDIKSGKEMSHRRYITAYTLGRIMEVLSGIFLGAGILLGLALLMWSRVGIVFGIMVIIGAIALGIISVFISQLILIFIDIENNTRMAAEGIRRNVAEHGRHQNSLSNPADR